MPIQKILFLYGEGPIGKHNTFVFWNEDARLGQEEEGSAISMIVRELTSHLDNDNWNLNRRIGTVEWGRSTGVHKWRERLTSKAVINDIRARSGPDKLMAFGNRLTFYWVEEPRCVKNENTLILGEIKGLVLIRTDYGVSRRLILDIYLFEDKCFFQNLMTCVPKLC